MSANTAVLKAAVLSALASLVFSIMVYVPVWFVLAFISRLATGQVHLVTFVLAGVGALAFLVWVFRLVFAIFRKRVEGNRSSA
ncbi:MAG TPA: hypothetical protein VGQ71_01575 [Terriglobales bacterium]|jgi:hypothetical protein|nr:hypothetical protein [Terriglobales bacterium]